MTHRSTRGVRVDRLFIPERSPAGSTREQVTPLGQIIRFTALICDRDPDAYVQTTRVLLRRTDDN